MKQFDTHCIPKENIIIETGGREAFVMERSKVDLKKMSLRFDCKQMCKIISDGGTCIAHRSDAWNSTTHLEVVSCQNRHVCV